MKIDYADILLLAFLPLVVRIILYRLAFKVRSIHMKFMNCIIIAGTGSLAGAVPIPLPSVLRMVIAIGLAMFLITRYAEAELFPDVILIPVAVELASLFAIDQILLPLMR